MTGTKNILDRETDWKGKAHKLIVYIITIQTTKFSTSLWTQISFGNDSLHNNLSFNWVQILSPNKISHVFMAM